MAATIKDIARTLNISVSTVSYALNGGPRSVPAGVKDLVLSTARDLGYRPNRNARSLITGRSHAIGIVPTSLGPNMGLGPYFQYAVNGILNRAEEVHQDVMIFTRHDVKQEGVLNDILDGRVDGVIFLAPPAGCKVIDALEKIGMPHVVVSSGGYDGPCYTVDNKEGVYQALDHLYQLGHRRIGHISGDATLGDGQERLAAFKLFMSDNGLPVHSDHIVPGDFTIAGSYESARTLLRSNPRPTAVFCGNDEMALALLRAAHELGLKVPEELSIVGFDDTLLAAYSIPALTTIQQPIMEMASEAMAEIVRTVREPGLIPSKQFSARLIIRASTTCPKEDINSHE